MNIYELMESRRTIRKFTQVKIPHELLVKFVKYARLSPTGSNKQPVRYAIIDGEKANKVFPHTHWAGALKGKGTPTIDEKPMAFILLLIDESVSQNVPQHDTGAVAQSIQLMAQNEGIGVCWMGAIDREKILKICNIPDGFILDTLLSLGYPAENPVYEDVKDDSTTYYKDSSGKLHVPKRSLGEVLLKLK